MKQYLGGVGLALVLLLLNDSFVFARSGCCSSHRGVCGCGCCDGTPLSAKCAPYYPQCNSGGSAIDVVPVATAKPPTRVNVSQATPKPTKAPTPKPSFTTTPHIAESQNTPAPSPEVLGAAASANQPSSTSSDNSLVTLLFIGGLMYGAYIYGKRRKANEPTQQS